MSLEMTEANVLIVDDEVGVRDSMHEFLEMAGFQSKMAASAEEAIDLLRNDNIQVVITDIMLPGMGGLELTKLIKHRSVLSDLLAILATADRIS